MTIDEIKGTVSDLVGVEPKSVASDRDAAEANAWVSAQKQVENDVEELLGPEIKKAFDAHKKLTGQKKTLLEKLGTAKDRVRAKLANWIAAGHPVEGCYTKTKYRVTVDDQSKLPPEYLMTVPNMEELQKFVDLTEGKQAVDGVTIEPVHILYASDK
jgi:hypothetical protein